MAAHEPLDLRRGSGEQRAGCRDQDVQVRVLVEPGLEGGQGRASGRHGGLDIAAREGDRRRGGIRLRAPRRVPGQLRLELLHLRHRGLDDVHQRPAGRAVSGRRAGPTNREASSARRARASHLADARPLSVAIATARSR